MFSLFRTQLCGFGQRLLRGDTISEENGVVSSGVWIYAGDGQLKRIRVDPGLSDVFMTEVSGGELSEGQQIVVGIQPTEASRPLLGIRIGF